MDWMYLFITTFTAFLGLMTIHSFGDRNVLPLDLLNRQGY